MVAVRRRLDLRLQRLTPWKRRCSAFVCQLGSSTLAHHQQLLLLLGQLDHSICSIAWPAWPLAGDTWTTLAKTLTPATGFFQEESGSVTHGQVECNTAPPPTLPPPPPRQLLPYQFNLLACMHTTSCRRHAPLVHAAGPYVGFRLQSCSLRVRYEQCFQQGAPLTTS